MGEEFIYVLDISYDNMGENPHTDCIGIFSTVDRAKERMKEKIKEFQDRGWLIDEWYDEGDMTAVLFWDKQENWNDFIEITTYAKELDV